VPWVQELMLQQVVPSFINAPRPFLREYHLSNVFVLILVTKALYLSRPIISYFDCIFFYPIITIKDWVVIWILLDLLQKDFEICILWIDALLTEVPVLWTVPEQFVLLLGGIENLLAVPTLSEQTIKAEILQLHVDEMVGELCHDLAYPPVFEFFSLLLVLIVVMSVH
jgi:hypothetical protein